MAEEPKEKKQRDMLSFFRFKKGSVDTLKNRVAENNGRKEEKGKRDNRESNTH